KRHSIERQTHGVIIEQMIHIGGVGVPLVLEQHKLLAGRHIPRWIDDHGAKHAVGEVHDHRIGTAVIEENAWIPRHEVEGYALTRLNGTVVRTRIHLPGVEVETVLHVGVLVDQGKSNRVPLVYAQCRRWNRLVERPYLFKFARRDLQSSKLRLQG